MKQHGLICDFRSYSPTQLEKMKQDLAIAMPLQAILTCQNYYRKVAARDPFIEELGMLDRLASSTRLTAAELTLSELTCTDRFAAQTHSDLLEKRRTVYPDRRAPLSLAEMPLICEGALHRAGKRTPPLHARLHLEPRGSDKNGVITQKGARFALRPLPAAKANPGRSVKLLVLIRATENSPKHILSVLQSAPDALAKLQTLRPVGEDGLLREILSICNGANVAPEFLARPGMPLSLSEALCGKENAILATVAQEDFHELSKQLTSLSLIARSFGAVTDNGRISILEHNVEQFALRVSFLRALLPSVSLCAELKSEAITREAAPIATASHRGMLCASAAAAPNASFFLNTIDTVLSSVLTLCASGVDYTAQSLAVALAIPADPSETGTAGEALSALLGLYRLQAELSLTTAAQTVELANVRHPEITVYSVANGAAVPTRLTRAGASVYCLSPRYLATGLPDFDSVRSLLALLVRLRQDGLLESAHVLARKTVADALKETYTDELVCNPLGDVLFSSDALRLGILIQTARPIDAPRVAITARRSSPPQK